MRRLKFALIGTLIFALLGLISWFFVVDPNDGRRARPRPVAHAPAPSARPLAEVDSDLDAPVDAPERVAPAAPPRERLRLLSGLVSDPEGTPVPGATLRVVLGSGPARVATTDPAGEYDLAGVPDDVVRLEVSARGYAPRTFKHPAFPDELRVRWDVELEPAHGVHGVVLHNGQPAPDAWVSLRREMLRSRLGAARADGAGRFALPWPEGDDPVVVSAWHGQHGTVTLTVDGPGEVTLELPGGGFVEGRVVDEDGDPVSNFWVSASPLTRRAGGPPAESRESGHGGFSLGPLAPGTMTLYAAAEGYQPAEVKGVQVTSGETTSGVEFVLKRSTTLRGRVTDDRTGRPIEGALVVPAEWRAGALADAMGAYTNARGEYLLQALPGKRTSINVTADGYRSLLVGGVEGLPGQPARRDFSLSPLPRGGRPTGELTGIGAVLMPHRDGVRIGTIMEGGPASEALARGDVVVMVDGESVKKAGLSRAAQLIRGEIGTDVVLWVKRGGRGEPERVVLNRGRVELPARHHRN